MKPILLKSFSSLCIVAFVPSTHHMVPAAPPAAPSSRNIARVVVWQPKPGMEHDMEEGYKRHLGWHRKSKDTWAWYGWSIVSGEHDGYFMDGTFFRTWAEIDAPVSPAEDGADNAVNVDPYGDARSVAMYEIVSGATNMEAAAVSARQMNLCYFQVQPGHANEFESLAANALEGAGAKGVRHMLLRPVSGTTEYMLFLPGERTSDLGPQAEFVSHLLQTITEKAHNGSIVTSFHTELARYRPELSYRPDEK